MAHIGLICVVILIFKRIRKTMTVADISYWSGLAPPPTTHTYTFIYIYTHIYTYPYTHKHKYRYIFIHTYIHLYTYVYIHLYIPTYLYTLPYPYTPSNPCNNRRKVKLRDPPLAQSHTHQTQNRIYIIYIKIFIYTWTI